LFSFLVIGFVALLAFQLIVLYSIPRIVRVFIFSHRGVAAGTNIGMSFFIMIFVGVGNIVGICNLLASSALAAYILVLGNLSRSVVRVRWDWKYLIIPVPKASIETKEA